MTTARVGSLVGLWVVATLSVLAAQDRPFSMEDIEELVSRGVSDARILELARRDCLLFKLDKPSEEHLRNAGATPALVRGLRRAACYAGAVLEVTSEPGGIDLWVGGQPVGQTPWRSDEAGRTELAIEVRRGAWTQRITTRLPAARLVRVHFAAPVDTLPWPVERSRAELAAAMDDSLQWIPLRPEPVAPAEFTGKPPKTRQVVGAIIGAIAGGAVGYAIDPHDDSLSAPIIGLALVGTLGWWVGKKLDDSAYRRRQARYQQALRDYDTALEAWRAQIAAERAEALGRLVDSVVAVERERADSLRAVVEAENARIAERNRTLPAPTVVLERMP